MYVYHLNYMARKGKVSRKTKETSIDVELNIDGKGKYQIDTGIGFLDHMLEQLSKHSLIAKPNDMIRFLRNSRQQAFTQYV